MTVCWMLRIYLHTKTNKCAQIKVHMHFLFVQSLGRHHYALFSSSDGWWRILRAMEHTQPSSHNYCVVWQNTEIYYNPMETLDVH